MVATRRGVRVVESPTKTTRDESSSASDSGTSSRRRTRKTAAPQEEDHPPTENKSETPEAKVKVISADAQEEKPVVEEPIAPVENQPDDIHDADVSDSESCCSVVSDSQGPSTRSTRRRGRPAKTPAKTKSGSEAVSEAESCASAVSATPRRSTRTQKKKVGGDGVEISEAESCSSATSLSRRGTRSQRKTAAPQSASHTEDTELSEHESPRDDLRTSTLRKSTRGRRAKPVEPVPIDLEDSGDVSSSSLSRKTPGRRAKAAPAETSEDHKSAASTRRSTRSRAKDPAVRGTSDSESDLTGYSSMGSPRGTPCSSRTGSASSNRAVIVTRVTRSLRSDLTHASSPLRAEAQTPSKGDAPLSDTMETEETMEVDEHEATVVVTGEEGQASLLAEEGEGDKTLIAEEEEEKEKGVIVVDPAVLEEAEENTSTAGPSVVVTETQSPDTEMTEEISPAVEEPAGKVPPKASVIVSGETGEAVQSDLGSVDTQETPCADSASVTVFEVAEADTTEEVDEGNDKPQPATDDQVRSEQTVKVTAELDSNTAEVTGEIAEVETVAELDVPCEQAVRVTICDASESKEETLNDVSVHADSSIQDAAEDDKEPTVLHGSSVQSVQVQQDEEDQPMEVDSTDDVLVSRISSSVHVEVSAAQEGDQLPTGSGTSLKRPAVSLLDSSDDEEEDDSDACSLTGEPAKGQEASESEEDDDDDDDDEAVTAFAKPKAKAQIVSSDGLFVIDTAPQSSRAFYTKDRPSVGAGEGQDGHETMKEARGQEEEDEEFVDEEGDEEDEDSQILFTSRDAASKELSCAIDPGLKVKELGGLYISFDGSKSKQVSSSQKSRKDHKHLDELMKKSVIVPDLEKKESIPPYKESMNATKLKRRLERQKTTGDGWFNMKAPEMTEELKNDLKALQMRSAMDPKRFYKKNDREGFAKYVQVGTVVDSPLDFYNSRIPKKERKRTMVEELLADAEFRSYNKKKFQEIMTDRAAQLAGKKHRKKKFKSK